MKSDLAASIVAISGLLASFGGSGAKAETNGANGAGGFFPVFGANQARVVFHRDPREVAHFLA